ncbi:DUF4232 domain-containing protein [Saccharopolyspora tripterygii]
MARTRIILAATAALLTAGLSACDEEGGDASSSGVVVEAPATSSEAQATEEPPPSEAEPSETASEPSETVPDEGEQSAERLCEVADLTVTVKYVDAGAGTVHRALQFTNSGGRTCEIQGFAGVSFVGGEDGHQIGKPADRVGDKGPAITLRAGAQAWAPLASPHAENYDPATCRPEEARGLRIYPPQEYDSLFIPLAETACGNPDLPGEQLKVETLHQGTPS